VDTLYVELLKCDSIVKIDNRIIASQDTIIADQKELIAINVKEIKKQKRKILFTKIGSGIIIVAVLLLK
jgi:phosphate uptake regulator